MSYKLHLFQNHVQKKLKMSNKKLNLTKLDCFCFIKKQFLPEESQQKFSYNFNQFEPTAEKVLGLIVGDLCLLNVHCCMEETGRMATADHFDQCFPSDRVYCVIIAGDFNSFPDGRGPEQIDIIRKVTDTNSISDIALSESSQEIAPRSFKAYPYDKVPEEALKMTGKLDHIFVKGLKVAEVQRL